MEVYVVRYAQNDDIYKSKIGPNFAATGCAACCMASAATYLLGESITPITLYDKKIIEANGAIINWNSIINITKQDKSASASYQLVYKEIQAGRPVLMNVTPTHYVLAYKVDSTSAETTSAMNIYIMDPEKTNYKKFSEWTAKRTFDHIRTVSKK